MKKRSPRLDKDHKGPDGREKAIIFLNIIFWPFKMIFIGISYIFKGTFWIFEKIFGAAVHKVREKKGNPDSYVPFRVVKQLHGTYPAFESFLLNKDSTIGIILGARGSGKSALGLKLLENLHAQSGRNMFTMGFNTAKLPSWIKNVETLEEFEKNSFVLIDEGGILFSSRKSFSDANTLLSELLLIARHKDISVIFISQNSSNLEINAIRQTDYLLLKPSSLLQMDFERKKIKEIYTEIDTQFKTYKRITGITYVYADQFRGFVSNTLPAFWTQRISKNFREK